MTVETVKLWLSEESVLGLIKRFHFFLFSYILGRFMKLFRWCPSSRQMLEAAEKKILSHMKKPYKGYYVDIGRIGQENWNNRIYTVTMDPDQRANRLPLVLLHGFGCGSALWVMSLENLSKYRTVHAIDLLGFARSSRPFLSTDAWEAEQQMVESIEQWRKQMGLNRFVLLGHSLGGFLASSYALKYPTRIAHLVLEDPWGFPEYIPNKGTGRRLPWWAKVITTTLNYTNAMFALRAIGILGPFILENILSDAKKYFGSFIPDGNDIIHYVYHCNVRRPSGEALFRALMVRFGWTKHPMIHRLVDLPGNVPVSFIYGSNTFITKKPGFAVKQARSSAYVDVQLIPDCGHNIHMEKPEEFTNLVLKACDVADNFEQIRANAYLTEPARL